MASSSSISGLSSGLDTATIVTQLMQLEALPQTRLKTRVTAEQSRVTALQSLNTKLATLATKAADLAKATTWSAASATSSNTSVGVTTTSGASPTQLHVTVTSVARTHQLGFASTAALTDQVTGASNTVRLDRFDGSPVDIDTGDGTLQGLVDAINDPDNATGLHATAVKTTGGYRLLVESTATGVAQDFDLTAADGSPLLGGAVVRAGSDAALDLGAGISVTSTSNTFADLVPGVTLTLSPETAVGAVSTIGVQRDSAKLNTAVSDLVTAMNAIVTEIDGASAYNSITKTSGLLGGDASIRQLRSSVLSSVFPTTGNSLASVGINTTRDGKLVFDAAAFTAAYASDPEGTAERFTTGTDGFAARVETMAKAASDPYTGTLSTSITGRQSGITRIQSSIDNWDTRLELRQASLTKQFNALEVALNRMSSQSSWLTSQLSALSGNSSDSNS